MMSAALRHGGRGNLFCLCPPPLSGQSVGPGTINELLKVLIGSSPRVRARWRWMAPKLLCAVVVAVVGYRPGETLRVVVDAGGNAQPVSRPAEGDRPLVGGSTELHSTLSTLRVAQSAWVEAAQLGAAALVGPSWNPSMPECGYVKLEQRQSNESNTVFLSEISLKYRVS